MVLAFIQSFAQTGKIWNEYKVIQSNDSCKMKMEWIHKEVMKLLIIMLNIFPWINMSILFFYIYEDIYRYETMVFRISKIRTISLKIFIEMFHNSFKYADYGSGQVFLAVRFVQLWKGGGKIHYHHAWTKQNIVNKMLE